MKKMFILTLLAISLAGCGKSAVMSEYYQHHTMYRNWDHAKFSIWGYKNPTAENLKDTTDQQWWGIKVPNVPGN